MTFLYFFYLKDEKINESTFPLFRLTKSKNGKTGTAVFYFLNPKSLQELDSPIKLFSIESSFGIFSTSLIQVLFFQGKPSIFKIIFIFRNFQEWKTFLDVFLMEISTKNYPTNI